jgi:hypothetical protein
MNFTRTLAPAFVLTFCNSAVAQLQITEIMYNPLSANDFVWEWIEVRNTGGTEVDLNGAFMDRLGDDAIPATGTPNIGANSMNTIIPAGGVAVIYDAFYGPGNPSNYNDQIFRDAWGLAGTVPLIGADFFPELVNGAGAATSSMGIWATREAYDMDVDDMGDEDPENDVVGSFVNTIANIDYDTAAPWPLTSGSSGKSIEWSGNGMNSSGGEWSFSVAGQRGADASDPVIGQDNINSTDDYANPGDVFSSATGTPGPGLYITEIMYNPASPESDWEWVEVYNNTGATIDFNATPYVFDDDDEASLTAANVTSGSIANGEIAVLYNSVVTQAQIEEAWGDDINFIPVANFTSLTNSQSTTTGNADLAALWPSLAAYQADDTMSTTSPRRTFDSAAAAVLYSVNANGFPASNGDSSIYVSSFTPGTEAVGDYNGDGEVNNADYAVWRDTLGSTTDLDADGSGNNVIDQADYDLWMANFGQTGGSGTTLTWALDEAPEGNSYSPEQVVGSVTIHPGGDVASPGTFIVIADGGGAAVPEPTSVALLLLGAAAFGFLRRSS